MQPPCPLAPGGLILHGMRGTGGGGRDGTVLSPWLGFPPAPRRRLGPGPAILLPVLQLLAANAHGTLVALRHAHLVPAALHLLAGVLGGVQAWGGWGVAERGRGRWGPPRGAPAALATSRPGTKHHSGCSWAAASAPAAASRHAPAPPQLPAGREKPPPGGGGGGCAGRKRACVPLPMLAGMESPVPHPKPIPVVPSSPGWLSSQLLM